MRVTDRDRKVIKFLGENNVVCSTLTLAKLFYCESHNLNSSVTIANRRLTKLVENQYIQKLPRKFGEQQLYYCSGSKPNQTQLRHKVIMSNFLGELVYQGYKLLDVKFEYTLPEKYKIRSDMFITIEFNHQIAYLFVEVDLHKELNPNYLTLISDIENGLFKCKYPIYFVSISDFKIKDETLKKNFISIDTDLENIVKLSWRFIK